MDPEQVPPQLPDPQTASPEPSTPAPPAPAAPSTSLLARLLNVFAVPGDVFDEVKASRGSAGNWLLPAVLCALITSLVVVAAFSQPATIQKMMSEINKGLDQQVQSGAMTRDKADEAAAAMEKYFPITMKIAGSATSVLFSFARIFWWGLVLWLMARRLYQAPVPYMKTVEAAGLATMITVLGGAVTLLLVMNLGKVFSAPSLALALDDFNIKNKAHLVLGAANVFSFWFLGVLSSALARLSGIPFLRAFFAVFTFWLIQETLLILTGLGQFAL